MKLTSLLRRFLLAAIVPLCLMAGAAAETMTLPVYISPSRTETALRTEEISLQGQTLEDRLYEGLLRYDAIIDISDFNLHMSESNTVTQAVFYLIQNRTGLEHFNGGFQIVFDPETELITEVRPGYFGVEQPPEVDRTEELLNEILAMIDTGWSDFEKVLFINDYLTSNFEYDLSYSIYDIENFLTYGTGVCEAYYLTARALMDALGIPSCAAISDNADHIWNVVQLNGKWYHLDITWNDPVYDALGASRHNYFLVSTQQLHRQDQNGYSSNDRTDFYLDTTGVSCTDTTYDGYYWTEVETPFVRLNGQWYYSNNEAICRTSDPLVKGTSVIKHGRWPHLTKPGWTWTGAFTGLGSCGDWLIYNTANEVMAYRPTDGAKEVLYKNTDSTLDIYGLKVNDTTAICALSTSPNDYMVDTATVSLAHLSYPNERQTLFRGLKIYEGSGCITVTGKPNSSEPFYLMAASYSDRGQLLDIKMISSQQITGTTFQWTMKSEKTQLFLTNPNMTPAK